MPRTSHLPNFALVVAWVTSRLVTKELRKVLEADPPRISFLAGGEVSPTDSEPVAGPFRSRPRGLRDEPSGDLGKRIVASMQQIAFRDSGQSR
jgi:hypothetical protein